MKNIVWTSLAILLAASLGAAESDAPSAVKAAAKKLGDKENYSWNVVSQQEGSEQAFRMTTEGKTEKSGLVQMALTFGERTTDVVLKSGKVAVKMDDEWKSADELEGRGAWMARRFKEFKAPAAEVEELAGKAKALKTGADGLYSGELTEAAVKEMLTRFRRGGAEAPSPTDMKGSVKFWVKDGTLTKYEYNVQGKMTVGQDNREMNVNRTTTTEIKEVGTTKLSVPEDAKKKLS